MYASNFFTRLTRYIDLWREAASFLEYFYMKTTPTPSTNLPSYLFCQLWWIFRVKWWIRYLKFGFSGKKKIYLSKKWRKIKFNFCSSHYLVILGIIRKFVFVIVILLSNLFITLFPNFSLIYVSDTLSFHLFHSESDVRSYSFSGS